MRGGSTLGNFEFLLEQEEYRDFSRASIEAEKSLTLSTVSAAIMTRRALELAVKWVYKVDPTINIPYRDNLASLVYNDDFQNVVGSELVNLLSYIIKLGNLAAHESRKIDKSKAVIALRNLFEFIQWVDYCYGDDYVERKFDESLIDTHATAEKEKPVVTIELVDEHIEKEDTPLVEQRASMTKEAQNEFIYKKETAKERRTEPFKIGEASEAETRKELIDVDLALAGWEIDGSYVGEEVELEGMPNSAEKGYADYVLYGQNGLPLAVVEAKRTQVDPNIGEQQAKLYADLLEKKTGQRPFIFTSNGFKMWFTDDERRRVVSGFYNQADLQRLVDRRILRKPLASVPIQDKITNRPYQKEAITRTMESFSTNRREALLVMATGTGKTRTAISIVDIMTKANWAKNILFLADRTALVNQAMKAFNELLPEVTQTNLTESRRNKDEEYQTSRMIFSTYPTMMNAIDDVRIEGDERLFSVGHFDLIIIDEAHRSIYKKYQAIFDYFDARIVGLTATPREDIDKNTYSLFNLENGVPTYAYDLEQAIDEGYLVDYRTIEAKLKLPTEGIKYDDLSPEEREEFDDVFEEDPDIKDIDPNAVNSWLFNKDTINKVIHHFMTAGIKDSTGDEIGKTIIFAKNSRHAEMIKDRFDVLYPEKGPEYAQIITYEINYAQSRIDSFSVKNKMPRIAISVNMLDTGIDVPEVVNLVFFKKVRSKVMFWQMIGRGTRLSEDLFGPGLDKEEFLIFDYGQNFEFFRAEEKPGEERLARSLTERLFNIQTQIALELQDLQYQGEPFIEFRKNMVDNLHRQVNSLDETNFRVRQNLQYVRRFAERDNWDKLTLLGLEELEQHIAPLLEASREHELTQRFDLYMFVIELSKIVGQLDQKMVQNISDIARNLSSLGTVQQVADRKETLQKVQTAEFWTNATIIDLEQVRFELRDLMQLLVPEETKIFYTDFDDEFIEVEENKRNIYTPVDLTNYKEKVENYITLVSDNPVIDKIYKNQKITSKDIKELERVLFERLGSREEYVEHFGEKPIPRLVREIKGLDDQALNEAFSDFISKYNLNSHQMEFVRLIMDYYQRNGYLEKSQLMGEPFKSTGGLMQLFDSRQQRMEIIYVIEGINKRVEV